MGGIGKTQLAVAFARKHHHRHSAVFWLNGSSREQLEQSLVDVAAQLPRDELPADTIESLRQEKVDTKAVVEGVTRWLCLPTNKHWLLVIDNVDRDPRGRLQDGQAYALEEYLSLADHGSVLVISRMSQGWQAWHEVRVGNLDETQSRLVLENSAGIRLTVSSRGVKPTL